MAHKAAKAKVPNEDRPPSTEDNGERAITGQTLVRLAKARFGMLEASDEHSFKDVAEGRPTAVAKDCVGRFQNGGCSRKTRKDQTGSIVVRGPPCRAGTGDGLAGLRQNKNRGPLKQTPYRRVRRPCRYSWKSHFNKEVLPWRKLSNSPA
jgi:hypothetical protein